MTFENAKVIETDFTCSNGVIHVINSVVLRVSGPSAIVNPTTPTRFGVNTNRPAQLVSFMDSYFFKIPFKNIVI